MRTFFGHPSCGPGLHFRPIHVTYLNQPSLRLRRGPAFSKSRVSPPAKLRPPTTGCACLAQTRAVAQRSSQRNRASKSEYPLRSYLTPTVLRHRARVCLGTAYALRSSPQTQCLPRLEQTRRPDSDQRIAGTKYVTCGRLSAIAAWSRRTHGIRLPSRWRLLCIFGRVGVRSSRSVLNECSRSSTVSGIQQRYRIGPRRGKPVGRSWHVPQGE